MFSNNNFSVFIVIVFLVIGFFLITNINIWTSNVKIKDFNINDVNYIKIAGKIIKTELALTPETQEKGLSGRKELKEDESMLFVFNHMDKYSFWMKDMNFPIDIIWLAPFRNGDEKDLRIVYIKENAMPESYPEAFIPKEDSMYVLEVFSSFSEKNNLKEGDKVEFLSL